MYFIYLSSHILLNRELYKKMTEKEKERERERERERGTSLVAKNNG